MKDACMYFPGQNPRNLQVLPQKREQIGRLLMAKYGIDVDGIMAPQNAIGKIDKS